MEIIKKFIPVLILLAVSWYTHVFTMMQQRPQSVHMWAMCDRGSVARNFAQESMDFFHPRVHETKEGDGICGMEFPVMNYAAAICYRLFGFNEIWYRLIMFIVYGAGMIAAYGITGFFLRNFLNRALVSALVASSPVLTYYAANFIPDTAALGFILLSWYYFLKGRKDGTVISLSLFFVFLTLASLIKITAAIGSLILLGLFLMSFLQKRPSFEIGQIRRGYFITFILLSLFLAAGWIQYAKYLNEKYGLGVFLMKAMTPSDLDVVKITLTHIQEIWVQFYFFKPIYYLLLICVLVFIGFYKKVSADLRLITLGYFGGVTAFIGLMLLQFNDHDYYIITLLPLLLFLGISVFQVFEKSVSTKPFQYFLQGTVICILLLNLNFNRKHQEFRMDQHCWLNDWTRYVPYQEVEPFIQNLGIDRNQKAIAICDYSPNIALYFLNLKGWSVATDAEDSKIESALIHHPSYLVVDDSLQLNRPVFTKVGLSKLGQYKTIQIFTIRY